MRLRRARFTPVSKDRRPHAPFGRIGWRDAASVEMPAWLFLHLYRFFQKVAGSVERRLRTLLAKECSHIGVGVQQEVPLCSKRRADESGAASWDDRQKAARRLWPAWA